MHRSSLIALSAAALLAAGSLTGCRQEPAGPANVLDEPVTNLPAVVRPSPPLDRAGLLEAVAQAASAASAGAALPAELRSLDGRQFEVRIRFGCRGPTTGEPTNWLSWSYDPEKRTIRVRARPTISIEEPVVATIGGEGFEAAEGFWIPRPWLLQPVCPATAAVRAAPDEQAARTDSDEPEPKDDSEPLKTAPEPLPIRQRVGIAQFFSDTDSRTGRRDSRPYQAVHTLKEGQALGSQGFNLVLSGRLRAIPGRGVIACSAGDYDRPPDCIVSAEFQRVWIEQPETGEVIADWGSG